MYVQNLKDFNRVVGLRKHACAHCNNSIDTPPVIIVNEKYYHAGCAMQLARDILSAFGELYQMAHDIRPEPHLPPAEIWHRPSPEKSQNWIYRKRTESSS